MVPLLNLFAKFGVMDADIWWGQTLEGTIRVRFDLVKSQDQSSE